MIYYPPHLKETGAAETDLPQAGGPIAIIFPPFAEEMNRCRRMMTLQAEAFASAGIGTIVFDLSSTGDSSGDFEDALWEHWVDDGFAMVDKARELGASTISLLGIRLGAAIALTIAQKRKDDIDKVVLWQPVCSGTIHMTQFLRLRLAAALTGEQTGETTRSFRQKLQDGKLLEVGGYALSGKLTAKIEDIKLEEYSPEIPVTWLETLSHEPATLGPASERVIETWRDRGARVEAAVIPGAPYWSLQETTVAPALIQATTEILVAR
ncbi:MAG: exosortase A-associated hydrolase 2 [Alphaproteobacteria bacterium]|jgi:exosortase A-associated hydrolase 2